jgi:hypothetical protein
LLGVRVSEIHDYPLRPEGFEESLFATTVSRLAIMGHLLESPWLMRASELGEGTGQAAHRLREPVELKNFGEHVEVVRLRGRRRSWRKERVAEVVGRWREVGWWWDKDGRADRTIFRVLLAGGAVVEVARERSGNWFLVGVVD